MRPCILILAIAGSLAWSGAAGAQGMTMGMGSTVQHTQPDDPFASGHIETPRERYAQELSRLRSKMLRMTAQDGGQLSEAHRAALQRELDAINTAYAANARPPRR
ncbi:hypothetical protein [Phenylobacterium sp.]|uniref:hypothetical protein n=1 Tax=Phenylobacterium sp. TaxID=1871053 RepID=UPI002DEDC2B6|nr:hypothetical protein [Phenylobacterium sp.]